MLTIEEHARSEEAISAAFWPRWAHRWLVRQHARLRRRGYPPAEVSAHARAELKYFEQFSPWAVDRIEDEHAELNILDGAEGTTLGG